MCIEAADPLSDEDLERARAGLERAVEWANAPAVVADSGDSFGIRKHDGSGLCEGLPNFPLGGHNRYG